MYRIQNLFFLRKVFWLTVETNKPRKKMNFSDNLSPRKGNMFHLINFSGRLLALSGKSFSFDWFYQTRCLGMLLHLITFLRRSVTKYGHLFYLRKLSLTSCLTLLLFMLNIYSRLSRWKKVIDSSFWGWFFSSMVGLANYGLSIYGNIVLSDTGYFLLTIISLPMLQSCCYKLYLFSGRSLKRLQLKCFC